MNDQKTECQAKKHPHRHAAVHAAFVEIHNRKQNHIGKAGNQNPPKLRLVFYINQPQRNQKQYHHNTCNNIAAGSHRN